MPPPLADAGNSANAAIAGTSTVLDGNPYAATAKTSNP
jgi:hypothetical protein